jgi:hypothetical protein
MAMGGVGEAMLLGAAMGGGSAALMGGDPLKGALMGGLTGGAGAGISGMLPGAVAPGVITPAATPALTQAVAPAVTENLITSAATTPGITTLASGLPVDISNQILGQIAPNAATSAAIMPAATAPAAAPVADVVSKGSLINGNFTNTTLPQMSYDSFGSPVPITSPAYSMADPTGLAQQQLNLNSAAAPAAPATPKTFSEGMAKFAEDPIASIKRNPFTAGASALAGINAGKKKLKEEEEYSGPLSRFRFNPDTYQPSFYAAEGGIASLDSGGYDRMVGEQPMYQAMARGGISDLGGYSDYARGGRMLKGPGDGMSDNIPATIAGKRPARLADGEFVVPADVVSHLGNGSTDAGAKQLYAMMNKVRQARTGRKAQGREINPRQYVPA